MAAGKPCRCCPGGSALHEHLKTVKLCNNFTMIIFLSIHGLNFYQALKQKHMQYEGWVRCAVCAGSRGQRNARGTGPGKVWRGLARQTSLEVAGRLLCAAFCTTLLVRQPARPSTGRGAACPHLNSSRSHISEF